MNFDCFRLKNKGKKKKKKKKKKPPLYNETIAECSVKDLSSINAATTWYVLM